MEEEIFIILAINLTFVILGMTLMVIENLQLEIQSVIINAFK